MRGPWKHSTFSPVNDWNSCFVSSRQAWFFFVSYIKMYETYETLESSVPSWNLHFILSNLQQCRASKFSPDSNGGLHEERLNESLALPHNLLVVRIYRLNRLSEAPHIFVIFYWLFNSHRRCFHLIMCAILRRNGKHRYANATAGSWGKWRRRGYTNFLETSKTLRRYKYRMKCIQMNWRALKERKMWE